MAPILASAVPLPIGGRAWGVKVSYAIEDPYAGDGMIEDPYAGDGMIEDPYGDKVQQSLLASLESC